MSVSRRTLTRAAATVAAVAAGLSANQRVRAATAPAR